MSDQVETSTVNVIWGIPNQIAFPPVPSFSDWYTSQAYAKAMELLAQAFNFAKAASPFLQPVNAGAHVEKDFSDSMPCTRTAEEVMGSVETSFSSFGNFTTNNILYSGAVVFSPPAGQLAAGAIVPITIGVIANTPFGVSVPYVLNTSVNVTSSTSSSLVFATVPGHLLYPATISFSATNLAGGGISFSIHVSGTIPSAFSAAMFTSGGGNFEDKQWNNFLDRVRSLCAK